MFGVSHGPDREHDTANGNYHHACLRGNGVPTNQKITATFSEVMDPATITAAGTFTVAVAG